MGFEVRMEEDTKTKQNPTKFQLNMKVSYHLQQFYIKRVILGIATWTEVSQDLVLCNPQPFSWSHLASFFTLRQNLPKLLSRVLLDNRFLLVIRNTVYSGWRKQQPFHLYYSINIAIHCFPLTLMLLGPLEPKTHRDPASTLKQ